ncbi:hypothetical protein [Sphingomonas sp. 3-13AW]|uniref:hypothetical protein n=1 Tax=Sphingomonas sp. 3-13AW TaxID=3050450 RepID=UPI003BB6428F
MVAEVSPEPMSRTQFQPFIDLARQACARWEVSFAVNDASVRDAAISVRDALTKAAHVAAESETELSYPGDTPGLIGALPGITLASLRDDIAEGGNYSDEWGICFRITAGETVFDVPLVFGLEEESATSIVSRISGREHEFVCIEDIAEMTGADSVDVQVHADSWRYLKGLSKDLALDLITALPYRRPGVWDVFRGELSGFEPKSLPLWSEDDFQARFLLSVRYDMDNMAEARSMLKVYAAWSPEPFSADWTAWFPQVTDLLHAIGTPRPISGLSVVLHFAVEEENGFDWEAVNARNVVVACGLDPIQAHALLNLVRTDPHAFYDLPDTAEKRFTLLASSVIPDAQLASIRATSSGRSTAYDHIAADLAAKAEEGLAA